MQLIPSLFIKSQSVSTEMKRVFAISSSKQMHCTFWADKYFWMMQIHWMNEGQMEPFTQKIKARCQWVVCWVWNGHEVKKQEQYSPRQKTSGDYLHYLYLPSGGRFDVATTTTPFRNRFSKSCLRIMASAISVTWHVCYKYTTFGLTGNTLLRLKVIHSK